MALIDGRTARVITTVLVFALALAFLYAAYHTLIAFLFAIFFAYLVDPAVSWMQRFTRRRNVAIAVIYLLLALLLTIFFFFVGPKIVHQGQRLTSSLPGLLEAENPGELSKVAAKIGREHGWSEQTVTRIESFIAGHRPAIVGIVQSIGLELAKLAKDSWLIIVVPILAAFFLKDGKYFTEVALSLVQTKPQREFLEGVRGDLNQMLAHFIRAQLLLAVFSFVAYLTMMGLILHLPYALVLASVGGFLEFIPVVGPLVAAVVIIGVALITSYPHWLVLLIFLAAWRLTQDYVISPRILGRSLELHPLAAIFGVLAGAEVAGVLGVYLSIPVMATLRIVWNRWRLYNEKRRFGPLNEYSFGSEIAPQR